MQSFLQRAVLASVALVSFSGLGSRAAADPPEPSTVTIVVDYAAVRESTYGPWADLALAVGLPWIEGSMLDPDHGTIRVDRIACVTDTDFVCQVRGSFAAAFEAAQRRAAGRPTGAFRLVVRAPDPVPDEHSDDDADEETFSLGGDEDDRRYELPFVLPCDASHWVVAWRVPTAADCRAEASTFAHDRDEGTLADFTARGPVLEGLGYPGFLSMSLVMRSDPDMHFDWMFELPSANQAVAFEEGLRQRLEDGSLVSSFREELRSSIQLVAVTHRGNTVLLTGDVDVSELARETSRLSSARASSDTPPDSEAIAATEPFAELTDLRERNAQIRTSDAFAVRSSAPPNARPVVFLAPHVWSIQNRVAAELSARFGATYFVRPNGQLPHGAYVWTVHGAAARTYVDAALAVAIPQVADPCADGCVLVAAHESVEQAIEISTLDPRRYPAVVAVNPRRSLPLAPFPHVSRAARGTSLAFVTFANDSTDPGAIPSFEARWASLTHLSVASPTNAPLGDLVDSALRRPRATSRAGALALPIGGSRACRATNGTGAACRATVAAPDDESDLADLALACHAETEGACLALSAAWERIARVAPSGSGLPRIAACARGGGAACAEIAVDFRRQTDRSFRLGRIALLDAACERDHAASCEALAFAFFEGEVVPVSPYDELRLHARACELHDALACANLLARRDAFDFHVLPRERVAALSRALCHAGEWDRCASDVASSDAAERSFAERHLHDACMAADATSCFAWRQTGANDTEIRTIARIRCLLGHRDDCTAAPFDDEDEALALRDSVLETAARACDAGDRYACDGAATLLADATSASDRQRRGRWVSRACLLGVTNACELALDLPEATDLEAVRRFACTLDLEGACPTGTGGNP